MPTILPQLPTKLPTNVVFYTWCLFIIFPLSFCVPHLLSSLDGLVNFLYIYKSSFYPSSIASTLDL